MELEVVVNNKSVPIKISGDGSNASIKIAPGEGKIPTPIMREEHMDVRAFPRHHPTGKYGLNHPREFKLSPSQYFNQRLLNEDGRFSKDAFYVFMAASFVERHSLERQIDISGMKGKPDSIGGGEVKVHLTDMFDVFKKVKGTPKYWQTARNELVAKVKQLGPFHLFYTFSCGEMRWSEVFLTLLKKRGYDVKIPDDWDGTDSTLLVDGKSLWDFVNNVMAEKKHELFKEYTFLISLLFDARVKSFIQNILLGPGKDQLGEAKIPISKFSYRVEFQARGLPHIHGVCWIQQDYLTLKNIKADLMDNEEEAIKIADQLISCRLPTNDEKPLGQIVDEVQRHKHTKSCRKYDGNCRYGFPKLPSSKTIIAKPIEISHPHLKSEKEKNDKKARVTQVLEAAKKLLSNPDFNETMTLKQFCEEINTTEEEYMELLGISERGKVLIMKRECKERFINNYNPEMLTAWNANMDIQLVVDPYAVISYIASYMNKEETQTTPFLREALHENAGKSVKEKLKALKETYLTHRQIGASEAAYKVIPSLRLKDSNISCIFVVTGFPENRSRFFRKIRDDQEELEEETIEQEQDDSESESDDKLDQGNPPPSRTCKIEGREGTYKESITVIERYITRPKQLDQMCLGQFAISYIYTSKVPKRITFDEEGCSNEWSEEEIFNHPKKLPKYISMEKSGYGKMRLRKSPAVMRIHSSKKKVGHEQHYSELLLYTAWRDEEEELHADNEKECIQKFYDKIEEIEINKKRIYPGEETIALLEIFDLENDKPAHIFDMLDGQREQDREEDLAIGCVDDPEFESFSYTGNLGEENKGNYETSKYRKIGMISNEELNFLTRRLVPEQLDILREVVAYCKDVLKSKINLAHVVKQLKIVVHGGAGVGKSALIKVVSMHAEKILRKAGDKPTHPRVLLTAHTGKAASLIGGQTVSGAFGFRFGDEAQSDYGPKKLAQLREDLSELKLIIIDEMSLISSDMFYKLDAKLKEIFIEKKKTPFAGIGVMLVGDLLQIPPVTGGYIFMPPRNPTYRVAYDLHHLWNLFEPWILTHNHRQGASCEWANKLNRFRMGIVTEEDLKALKDRETDDPHHDLDSMHLCYSNDETNDHNKEMLSKLKTPLVEIEAIKLYPKGRTPIIKSGGRLEDLNVLDVLKVKIGARVVMVYNVNTIDDLVNGSTGTVKAIEYNEKKEVDCIIVKFDKDSMGREHRLKYPNLANKYKNCNGTPIFRQEMETMGRKRNGLRLGSGSSAKIYQFPLICYYASTNHKIQVQ